MNLKIGKLDFPKPSANKTLFYNQSEPKRAVEWTDVFAGLTPVMMNLPGKHKDILTFSVISKTWGMGRNYLLWKTRTHLSCIFNTLRPRQNVHLFADDTFKRIFLNENIRISTKNSLKFVPKGLINNIPALVLIMAWRRPGDKPLSEPMLVRSLTHICITRPQWVYTILVDANRISVTMVLTYLSQNIPVSVSEGLILSGIWYVEQYSTYIFLYFYLFLLYFHDDRHFKWPCLNVWINVKKKSVVP